VLAPPIGGDAGSILALLEGGESWSTSALACALGSSQRTVQRALRQLEEVAAVRAVGRGRSRRCQVTEADLRHCYSLARCRWVSLGHDYDAQE
jgi:DNA-binding transcriptional ArsR family regulator